MCGALMPAADACGTGGLPIGLSKDVGVKNGVAAGELGRWSDVEIDETDSVVRFRREINARLSVLP